jgi:hypothetical protein
VRSIRACHVQKRRRSPNSDQTHQTYALLSLLVLPPGLSALTSTSLPKPRYLHFYLLSLLTPSIFLLLAYRHPIDTSNNQDQDLVKLSPCVAVSTSQHQPQLLVQLMRDRARQLSKLRLAHDECSTECPLHSRAMGGNGSHGQSQLGGSLSNSQIFPCLRHKVDRRRLLNANPLPICKGRTRMLTSARVM